MIDLILGSCLILLESSNLMEDVSKTTTSSLLDTREPCDSERIIRIPNRFMFLVEAIIDELDLDSSS